jgi:hypothetical protein
MGTIFKNKSREATAVSGTATVDIADLDGTMFQISVRPDDASGTATLKGKPVGCAEHETIFDEGGNAESFSIANQISRVVGLGDLESIEVASGNSADTFSVIVTVMR